MKQVLLLASLFVTASGIWLGVMENILKHPGYVGRSAIAACLIMQSLATVLFLLLYAGRAIRYLITPGAFATLLLGSSAVVNILQAQHFEGFVLLIGLALILQSALTLSTLFQASYSMEI